MRTRTTPALATKLDGVHREFANLRRTRKPRSPIPAPLWALAVELAREYGCHGRWTSDHLSSCFLAAPLCRFSGSFPQGFSETFRHPGGAL